MWWLVDGSPASFSLFYLPLVSPTLGIHSLEELVTKTILNDNTKSICDTFQLKFGLYQILNTKLKPM